MLVHFIFILLILLISIVSYLKKSLTVAGAIAAFLLGLVLYVSGGVTFLAALFAFFVSSSLLTRYKGREKEKLEKVLYEKTGTRDHVQVFANGGAAFIVAVIHIAYTSETLIAAVFAAFAACNADTWASEIGVLSGKKPVSILTFKPMDKGISGGVSLLGTIGSLGGALLLAVFYIGARIGHVELKIIVANSMWILCLGFFGALIDSVLGTLLQPLYRNPHTGVLTEKKRTGVINHVKVKGFEFFSNDMVNFISSSLAAFLTLLIV